ncbi:MAG: lysostaphin resistance A-like protein [Chitinophagales bacterium]
MSNSAFFPIHNKPYAIQFLYLLLAFFVCYSIASIIQISMLFALGVDLESFIEMDVVKMSEQQILVYKAMQILFSVFIFILPAWLFSYWQNRNSLDYLQLNQGFVPYKAFLATVIILVSFPLMGYLLQFNQSLELPAFLSELEIWMKDMEEKAADLIVVFLAMDSVGDLLLNLLMIALIPAVGEELLFRGCLQQIFQKWFKNPHLAIWIAAAMFSFFHFQFYGFLPRLLIGVLLGYLFFWSGNLWYPIIGHLINNGIQVLAVYFGQMDLEQAAAAPNIPMIAALGSLFLLFGFSWVYRKNHALDVDFHKEDTMM